MTATPTPLTTADEWREHLLTQTRLADEHEMRLEELTETDTGLRLSFMAPHLADVDLVDVHLRIAAALPEFYTGHLVDVRRGEQIARLTPPQILVDLTPAETLGGGNSGAERAAGPVTHTDWFDWADQCPVLREFGLDLLAVHRDASGRQVNLEFGADLGVTPNLDDLRSQLARITMRLDTTAYATARAIVEPRENGAYKGAIIALRMDTDPDLATTEPAGPAAAAPRRRWGWQVALDHALISLYRQRHGEDAEVPGSYPENVHRAATLFGLALGAAGVATILTMSVIGVIGMLADALGNAGTMLASGEPARIVLGPVRAYTDAFLDSPQFTGSAFGLWAVVGGVCFLLGWLNRNTGARIGWCLWGAATAWMTWRGSSVGAQQLAVAIAACWWILGSLLVFRRDHRTPEVVAHVPGMDVDKEGRLTSRQHVRQVARQMMATVRTLASRVPERDARPGTVATIESSHNGHAVTLRESAEPNLWEQLLDDADEPGMVMLHEPSDMPGGQGFLLHFALPQFRPGRGVRTLSNVRGAIPRLEVLLGQRCPELFEAGIVTPGAVTVHNAVTPEGIEIAGEVIIGVYTGRILTPHPERLKPAIIEIARVAGIDGITESALHEALIARGFRALTRSALIDTLMVMRTRPGDMPRVVSAGGLITVEPDVAD